MFGIHVRAYKMPSQCLDCDSIWDNLRYPLYTQEYVDQGKMAMEDFSQSLHAFNSMIGSTSEAVEALRSFAKTPR